MATIQSLSGTGSLRVGGAFIQRFMPGVNIYLSDPTWGNHKAIFSDAGVPWKTYRYFDPNTTGLDFARMMADIEAAPDGSVILLHGVTLTLPSFLQSVSVGCAHSPTGIDPTKDQWNEIAELCIKKNHFPFFDVAYQGFATGSLDEDAYAPRLFVEKGLEIIAAQSYSKNLGLYAERVGSLTFVVANRSVGSRIRSQMKRIIMGLHCFLPIHGSGIVTEILTDPFLTAEWQEELRTLAPRVRDTRMALHDHLANKLPDRDFSCVLSQNGLFSYLGLNPSEVLSFHV